MTAPRYVELQVTSPFSFLRGASDPRAGGLALLAVQFTLVTRDRR